MFDGHARFLDGESLNGKKAALCSYPRSGNSFLRKTTESLYGLATGSTMSLFTASSL